MFQIKNYFKHCEINHLMRAQSSLFVVLGVVLLISVGFGIFMMYQSNEDLIGRQAISTRTLSDMRIDVQSYINSCIKHSVQDAMQDAGIREETILQYESGVLEGIEGCTEALYVRLKAQGFEIDEDQMEILVEQNPETVTVELQYPVELNKDGKKTLFSRFEYTFDRLANEVIPEGIAERDIRLISPNGLAEVIIPAGTRIKDAEGNPVELLTLKVEDVHFHGLENKYVVGELVYDNLPDGAQYSNPVEIRITFRDEDIPPGYTRANMKIAYYDEAFGMWKAMDTRIEGNRAIAYTTHNSVRSIVVGTDKIVYPSAIGEYTFVNRYDPCTLADTLGDEGAYGQIGYWKIGGLYSQEEGTASLVDGGVLNLNDYVHELPAAQLGSYAPVTIYGFDTFDQGVKRSYFEVTYGVSSDHNLEVICYPEPNVEMYNGITFKVENDQPFYLLKGCANHMCSECPIGVENCEYECTGQPYCSTRIGSEATCIPVQVIGKDVSPRYRIDTQMAEMPCQVVSKDDFVSAVEADEDNDVFGWVSYKCAGGITKAALKPDFSRIDSYKSEAHAADILYFETDGNAVGYEPSIKVSTDNKFFEERYGSEYSYDSALLIPEGAPSSYYELKLSPYAKLSIIGVKDDDPDYTELVAGARYISLPAYGVYGIKVWKTSKRDMCAKGGVVWEYWGSPAQAIGSYLGLSMQGTGP
jgi:hypothetical protein